MRIARWSRIVGAAAGALGLIAPLMPAAAAPVVTELPLDDGGMQRMLYAAPENPRAALILLPGGNGMVEFGPNGGFRRMGDSFLLRTLPLWQAQVRGRGPHTAQRHVAAGLPPYAGLCRRDRPGGR
jgi:hypothetical protein